MQSWIWSSCSAQTYPRIGDRRHLVSEGMSISWCGFSVASPAAWKPNSTKPECAECTELERKTAEREAWFDRLGFTDNSLRP